MKPVYIFIACVATFVAYSSAQIPPVAPIAGVAAPVIPPVFPPMLGGFPFPFLGPFGPLGLLGLGLGINPLLGLGLLGGLGPIGRLALLRGKRDGINYILIKSKLSN